VLDTKRVVTLISEARGPVEDPLRIRNLEERTKPVFFSNRCG